MDFEKVLEQKIAEINTKNNELLATIQQQNEEKLKGYISSTDFEEIKAKIVADIQNIDTEIAKLKSPTISKVDEAKQAAEIQRKAYGAYLRKHRSDLSPEELKVLQVADSSAAGVLAPSEYVQAIIKEATVFAPMRQIANIRQTSTYAVDLPTETATPAAEWIGEGVEKTEDTGLTYGLTEIKTYEMKMLFKATEKMLEDSAFNLEAEMATVWGRKFGILEGTAFYSGDGTTAPEGITINATVLADARDVITNDTLAFDDFIGTQYQLASPYVPGAVWVMNRSTMGVAVTLKSATTNTYLLQPNLQTGQPANILGSPVYEWADFPAITSTTLSTTPGDGGVVLGYGDFRQGYTIVDRIQVAVQRLSEKYAEHGQVGFLARKRVGGGVVLPAAIQLLKNQTT